MIRFLDWDPRLSAWGFSDVDLVSQGRELVQVLDVLGDDQSLMGTWARMRLWHWAYLDLHLRGVRAELRYRGLGTVGRGWTVFPGWLGRGRFIHPPLEVADVDGGFIASHRNGYVPRGGYTRRAARGWREGYHWRDAGFDVSQWSTEWVLSNPRLVRWRLYHRDWYCSCTGGCTGRVVQQVLEGVL